MVEWPKDYRLSGGVQLTAVMVNLLFGVLPGLGLFFFWVERSCFSFTPLLTLGGPLWGRCLWDFSLFLGFGAIHSGLAQRRAHLKIQEWIPPQLIRTFYLMVTGLSLVGMMLLWQSTGVLLWSLQSESETGFVLRVLSSGFYWGCMLYAGRLLTRFGVFEFLGLKQLGQSVGQLDRTEGMPQLVVTGLYRWVRHPVYSLTLAAFLVTPEMSLDRMLVFAATGLYLLFGIPLEERKLLRQFGSSYEDYRRCTPALIPFRVSIFGSVSC